MLGERLLKSVLYPFVPLVSCTYSGTTPTLRLPKKSHLLNVLPSPRPDMPQMESMVTADIVSFFAWNGACTS